MKKQLSLSRSQW